MGLDLFRPQWIRLIGLARPQRILPPTTSAPHLRRSAVQLDRSSGVGLALVVDSLFWAR